MSLAPTTRTTAAVLTVAAAAAASLALVPPFRATLAMQNAAIAASRGDLDEAEAHALRATALTPKDAAPYKILGQVYTRMAPLRNPSKDYFARAVAAYEESARRNPHDPYTFALAGWAHLYGGDAAAAEAAFLRTVALDPNNPYIRAGLGIVYLRQKKMDPTRVELEFARQYYPRRADIQAALKEIEQQRGRKKRIGPWIPRIARTRPARWLTTGLLLVTISTLGLGVAEGAAPAPRLSRSSRKGRNLLRHRRLRQHRRPGPPSPSARPGGSGSYPGGCSDSVRLPTRAYRKSTA